MKILVFGFSVTGDPQGYVEFWKNRYSANHSDIELDKIAIGGLTPAQGRHLVSSMIQQYQPSILIFEISTPIYRLRIGTADNITEHTETVNFLVRLCEENGILCGFLDLPQESLDKSRDWMGNIHHDLLGALGVPLASVDLQPSTLRDNVHPNDTGRAIYADALEDLVGRVRLSTSRNYYLAKSDIFFDAVHVEDLERDADEFVEFERNGFRTRMLLLSAGQGVNLKLSQPATIVGVIVAMGPKTGYMDIRMNGVGEVISCYDINCYYLRVGARLLPPRTGDTITVVQGQQVPDIFPLKGTKDPGERVGGITHVLFQKDWPVSLNSFL